VDVGHVVFYFFALLNFGKVRKRSANVLHSRADTTF
jgi:hypothetical protein